MNIPIRIDARENVNDVKITNSGQVDLDLSASGSLDIDLNSIKSAAAVDVTNTGTVAVDLVGGGGHCKVLYNTTANWNSNPKLKSKKGYIYIYSDYKQNEQGQNIAGLKVGDGSAFLIDLPFIDELVYEHINDVVRHITQEERLFWNNKVRCYVDIETDESKLIFTTN